MRRIFAATVINRPVEHVYEYVTTPGNWPRWHPSSLAVTGATNHSLQVGENVTEEILVAGHLGRAIWTVTEREAPLRWAIEGNIVGTRLGGRIVYTLRRQTNGDTFFERELYYQLHGPVRRLLDVFIFKRRLQRESTEALRRLRHRLEELGEAEPI